jgi:hypothetical protein
VSPRFSCRARHPGTASAAVQDGLSSLKHGFASLSSSIADLNLELQRSLAQFNAAPPTMNDEGLADAEAANPLHLPGFHPRNPRGSRGRLGVLVAPTRTRTHLSLAKDAPVSRSAVTEPVHGGGGAPSRWLNHQYLRRPRAHRGGGHGPGGDTSGARCSGRRGRPSRRASRVRPLKPDER